MIGLAFALLAASAAGPDPKRRDVVMVGPPRDLDLPERAFDSRRQELIVIEEADRADLRDLNRVPSTRTTSPTPRTRGGLRFNDWQAAEHEHQGKYLHQYARQPRANAHRICRGRP